MRKMDKPITEQDFWRGKDVFEKVQSAKHGVKIEIEQIIRRSFVNHWTEELTETEVIMALYKWFNIPDGDEKNG
jgi:hypothetical protein